MMRASGGRVRFMEARAIAPPTAPHSEGGHEEPEATRALVQNVAGHERHEDVEVEHEEADDEEQGEDEPDEPRAGRVPQTLEDLLAHRGRLAGARRSLVPDGGKRHEHAE